MSSIPPPPGGPTPPPPPGAVPPPPGGGVPPTAPAPAPAPAFGTPAPAPSGQKSFWAKLFDLDFTEFITPSVVKILYILLIIAASLLGLFMLIAGLASINDGGIVLVLIAPIYWFLIVVYGRVMIEVFIALIRTAQNTADILRLQGGTPGGNAPTQF